MSTETGVPIIRPMWYEFPTDTATFDLDQQFMFGSSILVAPKTTAPSAEHITYHAPVTTNVYLPGPTYWYYFYSGMMVKNPIPTSIPIADNEEGVFVREGTILPILNFERGRMSLLEAIDDPVTLLVYQDINEAAVGDLYLDDGQTFNYMSNERTQVAFSYKKNKLRNSWTLSVTKVLTDDNMYAKASGKFLNKVQVFNFLTMPDHVVNRYQSDMDTQNTIWIDWIYNEEEQALTILNFLIPVDSALEYGVSVPLIQIYALPK